MIQNKIKKSLLLDQMAGPFLETPFVLFVPSILGLVTKSEPRKFRLFMTHHIRTNASDDSRVPKENSQVHYDSNDDIVRLVF